MQAHLVKNAICTHKRNNQGGATFNKLSGGSG